MNPFDVLQPENAWMHGLDMAPFEVGIDDGALWALPNELDLKRHRTHRNVERK